MSLLRKRVPDIEVSLRAHKYTHAMSGDVNGCKLYATNVLWTVLDLDCPCDLLHCASKQDAWTNPPRNLYDEDLLSA